MTTPASRVTAEKTASRVSNERLAEMIGLGCDQVARHEAYSMARELQSLRSLSSDSVSDGSNGGYSFTITVSDDTAPEANYEREETVVVPDDLVRRIQADALDSGTGGQQPVAEYDPDAPPDHSADNAADFIFKHLSDALEVNGKWSVSDGTETWDGDVVGTLYNILKAAGIWDEETNELTEPKAGVVSEDMAARPDQHIKEG